MPKLTYHLIPDNFCTYFSLWDGSRPGPPALSPVSSALAVLKGTRAGCSLLPLLGPEKAFLTKEISPLPENSAKGLDLDILVPERSLNSEQEERTKTAKKFPGNRQLFVCLWDLETVDLSSG